MKRTLSTIGGLALGLWTVTGLVAWTAASKQVHVTFQQGDGSGVPDGSALIADEVAALSHDLDALVGSLDKNFRLVAAGLADEGERSAVEAARLEERISALERDLPAALSAREVHGALQSALGRLEFLAGIGGEATSFDEGLPVTRSQDAVHAPGPERARSTAARPEATTKKRSFLAFELPSRDFRFEGFQEFELLPGLSRVGFDAKSTLHDFTGATNTVSGTFSVDLSRPEDGVQGLVEARAATLTTGLAGRDEAMLEHLDATHHERIRFAPTAFHAERIDPEEREVQGRLHGELSIRGVTKPVTFPITAVVDEGRRLLIEGEAALLLSDYDIPVPSQLGMINMQDEIRVWVSLRARAKAGGAQ